MTVFGAQMRLYSKSKVVIGFIIMALVIPVLVYSGAAETIIKGAADVPPSASYLLILLPLFIIAIPAMMAGRILSSEFRNRTAYLLFTLPVSRHIYYFGKFLAAFVLSAGVFAMAYAFAIICGSGYGLSYPNDALGSFVMCTAGVFALTAMAYGLSTYFKKGSTGLVIAIMIFLPLIVLILKAFTGDMGFFDPEYAGSVWDPLMTLPPFTGFQSLYMIDHGIGGAFLGELYSTFLGPYSTFVYVAVSMIWGVLFLLLGMLNVNKKEL
jgi:ABC-2 type transport system permease protein